MSNHAHLELVTIEKGLRLKATAGSGQSMMLDSGEGMQAPSPTEALLIALGGCHAMDVISILRKKRLHVTAYHVDVSGERRTEHPRSYTKIEIVHRLRGHDLSEAAVAEAIHLTDTKYCSVHFSLDPRIEFTSRWEIQPA
jgi:putative redox protein